MGRQETLAAVREKYPQYADMSDDALGNALAAKYPAYKDLATPEKKPEGGFRGAMLKMLDAVPPLHKQPVANAAATMAAPTAGLGPVARVATQGALGGAKSLLEGHGKGDAGITALLDMAVSGIAEGVLGRARVPLPGLRHITGLGRTAEEAGAPARAFRYATEAPMQAWQELRARFLNARVLVPSLGNAKIPLEDAVRRLSTLTGRAYQQTRDELIAIMNRLDKQKMMGGPGRRAGRIFAERTSPERFDPSRASQFGEVANRVLANPAVRMGADAAVSTPMDEQRSGIPIGLVPLGAVADKIKSIPGALMGGH